MAKLEDAFPEIDWMPERHGTYEEWDKYRADMRAWRERNKAREAERAA